MNFDRYIENHIDGKQPLWQSYWVNSVLLSNIAAVLIASIIGIFTVISGIDIEVSILFANLCILPVLYWSIVGTWKSSIQYSIEHPNRYDWGFVARVFIIVGILRVILYYLNITIL